MAPPSRDYWNCYAETLPREKIQKLQIQNFRRLLSYAREHSVFYRKLYRDIDPASINTMEDIRALPLVEKEDLRRAQDNKEPFLFGELLGGHPRGGEHLPPDIGHHGKTGICAGKP